MVCKFRRFDFPSESEQTKPPTIDRRPVADPSRCLSPGGVLTEFQLNFTDSLFGNAPLPSSSQRKTALNCTTPTQSEEKCTKVMVHFKISLNQSTQFCQWRSSCTDWLRSMRLDEKFDTAVKGIRGESLE